MDKNTEKQQTDLRVVEAFLRAHDELKVNEVARQKRIYGKAVQAAENRRKKREEEQVCFERIKSTHYEPSEAVKNALKNNCGIDLVKNKMEE